MFEIVLTIFTCLVASAFCSVTEAAFYSIPNTTVENLVQKGTFTGKYISHVKAHIDRYIASVLILNTVANTMGVYLVTALAVTRLSYQAQLILPFVLTILILLFGEITPKTIGVKEAKVVGPVFCRAHVLYYHRSSMDRTDLAVYRHHKILDAFQRGKKSGSQPGRY
jgi:CBS domain containing-hemolysin-like protein